MGLETITPDEIVYWQRGVIQLDATMVFTWITMAVIVGGSWLITRRLTSGPDPSKWQVFLETVVEYTRAQIREIARQDPTQFVPFIGTLFVFIAVSNALPIIPGYIAPMGSLSTTGALAVCVFFAVPVYGILNVGVRSYLGNYVRPSVVMLPFNVIGELSRTLALAVRLFGNVMSGAKIAGILLAITPLFFPIIMHALGLLTGLIQAYIFAILAMVYIASATRPREAEEEQAGSTGDSEGRSEEANEATGS